jgi:hypothetical protein
MHSAALTGLWFARSVYPEGESSKGLLSLGGFCQIVSSQRANQFMSVRRAADLSAALFCLRYPNVRNVEAGLQPGLSFFSSQNQRAPNLSGPFLFFAFR